MVSLWNFVGMAVATLVIIFASGIESLTLFTIGFIALFTLSGVGNGSTYKMIPAIFTGRARVAIAGARTARPPSTPRDGCPAPSSASPARSARWAGCSSTSPSVSRS